MIQVKVKKLSKTAVLPTRATDGAAGYDLYADTTGPLVDYKDWAPDKLSYTEKKVYMLYEGLTVVVPTGIAIAIPKGYVGLVYPRSGRATKNGLRLANSVGVIDSDYRGEVKVALHLDPQFNGHGKFKRTEFVVEPGERIAQIVFKKYEEADWLLVDELDETERGSGGFGSTGV